MRSSTLLIVDDNPVDRENVERLLGGGYQCYAASTGGEGLEVCRRNQPGCVILDYRLPDRDGVSWLPSYLEQRVGIIMLTGVGDESIAVACLQSGAHDYLSKSELTRENLERAVRNATEKAQLIREVDLHHQIVSAMPIGVAVFCWNDRSDLGSLTLLWQNAAASRSAGVGNNQIGSTLEEIIPDILTTPVPQLVADTILTGESRALPEVHLRGTPYSIKTAALGGNLVAVLFEDITKQRQALDEHRKMEAQMRAAQRLEAVGRLAGGVAHDFNNVLTVIQSYALFVRDQLPQNTPAHEDLDMILDAANRATRLTGQLLAFSRRQVQSLRVVTLNDLVKDVERLLRGLIGEDIDLAIRVDENLDPVKVDPTHIEQVIVNLIVNARDAMPNGGKLTIETANVTLDGEYGAARGVEAPPGRYAMLAITDTGMGMDEETQQRIFEPFFTTKGKGGTGLGLSTVFGIVKQSGGLIWAYSEVGQGTCFKVYLPSVSEAVTSVRHPEAAPRVLGGTETVLVVEDEEMVRQAVCRLLLQHGYTVLDADNSAEAIDIAEGHPSPIHVLLSDIVMPDMSGPALADRVLQKRPQIRLIYMSGYTGHALVHRAQLEEGTALVQKPFTTESLLGTLRQILDQE